MRLIFNKSDNGTDELKALIPYVDADLDYDNLEPDVRTSTFDVIKLIGKELYQFAEDLYFQSEELTALEKEFIKSVRYPIAVNAYSLYAPTNDLSHTNNGRKMRSSDDQKNPFEWMIDRDNAAQQKRYFRALDDLIFFLDSQTLIEVPSNEDEEIEYMLADTWRTSDAFKLTQKLFVRTVDDFNRVFTIESRLLLMKLSPGMEDCETYEILPRVGKTKFDALKTNLANSEPITDAADIELLRLIKRACIFYSLSWSMMRLSVNLYPEGVLQHYTSDRVTAQSKKPSLNIEPRAAELAFKSDYERVLKDIETLLTPAPTPEATTDVIQPIGEADDNFFSA